MPLFSWHLFSILLYRKTLPLTDNEIFITATEGLLVRFYKRFLVDVELITVQAIMAGVETRWPIPVVSPREIVLRDGVPVLLRVLPV